MNERLTSSDIDGPLPDDYPLPPHLLYESNGGVVTPSWELHQWVLDKAPERDALVPQQSYDQGEQLWQQ